MPPSRLDSEAFGSDQDDDLLRAPKNDTTKRIFIAATRMNDGKTTASLALFAALREVTRRVGFIKPVGQRFVDIEGHRIDEDSYLLDTIFDVSVPIKAMSPIAIHGDFTRDYLDRPNPSPQLLVDRISRAFDRAAYQMDYIIIEGTGHAGVGSVFDLSNARTARILDAKAIIVARGGIGRPIDEIALNKALFDAAGVEVLGAIINKVAPEKIEDVRHYCGIGLERIGVPLLGCIPVEQRLTAPNISQIVEEIGARWINGRVHGANERVLRVVIGAMTAKGIVDYLQSGVLIITPGDREDILFAAIASAGISGEKGVSGIVLTRNVLPHPKLMEMLSQTSIPVVVCEDESFTVASKINAMTVKTQPTDTDKFPIITNLVKEHVDLGMIRNAFETSRDGGRRQ